MRPVLCPKSTRCHIEVDMSRLPKRGADSENHTCHMDSLHAVVRGLLYNYLGVSACSLNVRGTFGSVPLRVLQL